VIKKVTCRIEAETQLELDALIKIIGENPRIVSFAASGRRSIGPSETKPTGKITIQYEDGDDPNSYTSPKDHGLPDLSF
jgi:hypothetical protein